MPAMTIKSFLQQLQKWWLLFLVFAVPFSLKYITEIPFAISWLNVISVGFIGLGFFNLIVGVMPLQIPRHRAFLLLLGCVLLAMAYALLFTHPLRNGLGLWTSRLLQPLLVGFFAYQLLENNVLKVSQIVGALFWSIPALIVLGGLQYTGVIDYRDPGRITASYFYPNTFARYMDILLLITLPWILFSIKKNKRLAMGIWLLGVVLLLTSKSYNGAVSLFAGVVTLLLLLPESFVTVKRVALGALALVAVVVIVNAPKLPKWQTSIQDSRLTRLEFWEVARGVIKDNFWTGIGIKTWEKNYPQLVEKYYIQKHHVLPRNWGSVQPHNVFLDSFIKAGLPGFLAITALLLWPIFEGVRFARSYKAKNKNWWFGASLASYGVAMLVFGLIDDPIWSDDTMPLLFILYFSLTWVVLRASRLAPVQKEI